MTRDQYWQAWSAVHQNIDPATSVWVRGYLRVVYPVALVAHKWRVTPNFVTGLGIAVSAGLVASSSAGNLWLIMILMFLGIATDAVDGALAIGQNKTSAFGAVFDSVADRINEAALVVALLILAGIESITWALAAFLLVMIMEYMRARAHGASDTVTELVTVWERPTRVIVSIATIVTAIFAEQFTTYAVAEVALVSLVAWVILGLIANTQLVRHFYSQLAK